jgi:hypothetical protein
MKPKSGVRLKTLFFCASSVAMVVAAPSAYAQVSPVSDYFRQASAGSGTPLPYDKLLGITDQIAALSKEQAQYALISIFELLKQDSESGVQAAFALTVISRRPDSGDLLGPWVQAITSLLYRPDPRLKAAASVVFQRMNPKPVASAVPALSAFIHDAKFNMADKIDPMMALVRMAPTDPITEKCALLILSADLDGQTAAAALNALGNRQITSTKIVDAVASRLSSSDDGVVISAIQALGRIGPDAITRSQATLQRLSSDTSRVSAIRRLASNVLSGSAEACSTLFGLNPVVCNTH